MSSIRKSQPTNWNLRGHPRKFQLPAICIKISFSIFNYMLIGLSQQKKNIAKQPVIPTKRQRVEGSTHRFDHIADGKCVDPSTRSARSG